MCVCACVLSYVRLFVAHQASWPMEFSRQEYWSGLLFPSPGNLPDPGVEPMSLASPALASDVLPRGHLGSPNKIACQFINTLTLISINICINKY